MAPSPSSPPRPVTLPGKSPEARRDGTSPPPGACPSRGPAGRLGGRLLQQQQSTALACEVVYCSRWPDEVHVPYRRPTSELLPWWVFCHAARHCKASQKPLLVKVAKHARQLVHTSRAHGTVRVQSGSHSNLCTAALHLSALQVHCSPDGSIPLHVPWDERAQALRPGSAPGPRCPCPARSQRNANGQRQCKLAIQCNATLRSRLANGEPDQGANVCKYSIPSA